MTKAQRNGTATDRAKRNIVIFWLDPRIHSSAHAIGGMDRRVKPGDDIECWAGFVWHDAGARKLLLQRLRAIFFCALVRLW